MMPGPDYIAPFKATCRACRAEATIPDYSVPCHSCDTISDWVSPLEAYCLPLPPPPRDEPEVG